jgi:hypothetical protein
LVTPILLYLSLTARLPPLAFLVTSVFLFAAWVAETCIWLYCDSQPDMKAKHPAWCPPGAWTTSNQLDVTRDVLGIVAACGWGVCVTVASVAVVNRWRRERTSIRIREEEDLVRLVVMGQKF